MDYLEQSLEEISKLKNSISFLILTATSIETHHLHLYLKPVNGYDKVIKVFNDKFTFYIGVFGVYQIVHVQCGTMGSISSNSSIITTKEAIDIWDPKAVIMIGIAFGLDEMSQKIGDVLVSESLIPYNVRRVGEQTIYRGSHPEAGHILLDRFKSQAKNWNFKVDENNKASTIFGPLLSGEELIDNKEYRDQLLSAFRNAKGGEMEGIGVSTASVNKKLEWIVVKGICDFADGNKGKNKNQNQNLAAASATSLAHLVLSSPNAFSDLCFIPQKSQSIQIPTQLVKEVLFDFYSLEKEKFYLERGEDKNLSKVLDFYSVWVSGETGCGKTTSILRNLIIRRKSFVYINLAACIGCSINELFCQIYVDLIQNISPKSSPKRFDNLRDIIKEISLLLKSSFPSKENFIYIEEIPVDSEESFKILIQQFFSLIITVNKENIKFIFSSLLSPTDHIVDGQKKIYEKIKFLRYDLWSENDCESLAKIISENLNLLFGEPERKQIIEASGGSPRLIKRIFRDYIVCIDQPNMTLDRILKETLTEFK
ncbi:hypothetical protein [Sporocytophaga myxococcoides]|uniref:phosphorylase family protein n=1 Tax=Sporocytophaga myxococcoides TaxID=153721 RepID=UPI0004063E8A|nr:hypothetical protein [Sporocytophaga myxococcoides]